MAEIQEAELVRGQYCGMMIEQDAVSTQEFEGRLTISAIFHPLPQSSRPTPKRYLQPAAEARNHAPAGQENVEYICPMDPRSPQNGAGCLPQVRHGARTRTTMRAPAMGDFTCPMHPQISRQGRAALPILRYDA